MNSKKKWQQFKKKNVLHKYKGSILTNKLQFRQTKMFVTSEFGKKDCHLYFNSFLFDTDFTLNCKCYYCLHPQLFLLYKYCTYTLIPLLWYKELKVIQYLHHKNWTAKKMELQFRQTKMFVTSEFGKKDCHLYFNSFLFDTDFTLNCELSLFLINMERRVRIHKTLQIQKYYQF
jgi:hypothetical protein